MILFKWLRMNKQGKESNVGDYVDFELRIQIFSYVRGFFGFQSYVVILGLIILIE